MPLARICLLLAMGLLLGCASLHAEPLTKDRTVVILVGLPGDMESDQSYGESTLKLLKILNQPANKPANAARPMTPPHSKLSAVVG